MGHRSGHYVPRTANLICEQIALGKTIEEALEIVGYLAPSVKTFWRWIDEHEDFRAKYERARQLQADMLADKMLGLADKVLNAGGPAGPRYKVAADIYKWHAEVRNRSKFGSKAIDEKQKQPLDPAKIRAEIARLQKELGVAEAPTTPAKLTAVK